VLQAFTMFRRNARESAFSSSWAAYKRVYRAQAPAHTKLLLCFSRLRSSKMFNTGSDISKGEVMPVCLSICLSVWLAGWLAGWMDGWMAGWLAGCGPHLPETAVMAQAAFQLMPGLS
jgi:hypothetical protein